VADAADEARAGLPAAGGKADAEPAFDAAEAADLRRSAAAAVGDPDARLMLAFQGGDESAFAALFRRWSAPLLRHLERTVRERAIAEDLLQEAFLRVHRARARYVPQARFSTWLYTIATHLALNELRRPRHARRHRSLDDDPEEGTGRELVAPGAGADDVAHARRVGPRLAAALAALPERQREALVLSAVDGLSYAEVATTLGTTESSVKALVHRARATLAERLGEEVER
jgi:RNA polymerase sigma-70 factor (ECF subfamily)